MSCMGWLLSQVRMFRRRFSSVQRRVFVRRAFRALRLVVVMARCGRDDRFALGIARRVGEGIGSRCGMHAIVHGVCVSG